MEFSVPGFIKRFCTPNAILTLAEYLEDYATGTTKDKGWEIIEKNLNSGIGKREKEQVLQRIERIREGERDLYF